MITQMLETSRHARRHAFDGLLPSRDAAFAARELALFDEDAMVRARAALFLGKCDADIARPALHDAIEDALPLVRHAAVCALRVRGDAESFRWLSQIAIEDPIWWVRRAAVVGAAVLGNKDAEGRGAERSGLSLSRGFGGGAPIVITTLRAALEDPFWRVRNAAVRALLAMDVSIDEIEPATSARSEGALSYIARRLGAKANEPREIEMPNAIVARLDPDPAVVTARVAAGEAVSPAFLVECLGDPHESLRATAKKRLAKSGDMRALELALLWLDEPRIPHAAQTVIELLDRLDREVAERVVDVAFERGGFGAVCWAASYVALSGDDTRTDALLAHLHHERAIARCAVVAALGALGVIDPVREMLEDRDPRVVRTAAQALLENDALENAPRRSHHVRRLLLAAAIARGDSVEAATRDEDVRVRAAAIATLPERAGFAADPDPWIRAAAIDETNAAQILATDSHPWTRRAAFRVLVQVDRARAGELAVACDDSWLKTRGIPHLDPAVHLATLLRLTRDASMAVRATAFDSLHRVDDAAIDALLATKLDDTVRIAALAHRSRRFEDADLARLREARDGASEPVRAWLTDVLEPAPSAPRTERTPNAIAPKRMLGSTGIEVPALIVSGAGMLHPRDYVAAMRAGCTHFFWEPRYHTLGRMLSRSRDASVVCGTYEASERAIVADVERYLRRLRRDTLDVFLLYWTRSRARVDESRFEILSRLHAQGKIRAFGFSTHDREIACDAIESTRPWHVVMTRHSLVHPGAEKRFFPLAAKKNVGVLGFSAVSYGRALSPTISASDAYRYTLSQPGVSAVLTAPRTARELEDNLSVLTAPPLEESRQAELRAHGRIVHEESADFARSIRRHPIALSDVTNWLDHEDRRDILDPVPRASQS
jgi:aryl-alcohol dehydrogenase-like predicted oxidoreductase/HEAT repeat protein